MVDLMPVHVEYIAKYSGLRQQFINLFQSSLNTENAKFLLAVADYKMNPKWDSCMSIYHLFIREEGGGVVGNYGDAIRVTASSRINLPSPELKDIKTRMGTRRGQMGGLGDPNIFDDAFKVVLRTTRIQQGLKDRISEFLESHHIAASSAGEFTRFPGMLEVVANP